MNPKLRTTSQDSVFLMISSFWS